MKKIFVFVFILALCVSLSACDPGSYYLSFDELTKNVVRIDLIDYNNPEQKGFASWVPDHSDDLLPFDNSKCTIVKQLDDEKAVGFLKALSSSDILYHYYVFNSPRGISLRLTYENGDFLIVNCDSENESFVGYIGKYSGDGQVLEFYGCFSSYHYFERLVDMFSESEGYNNEI